MQNYMLMVFYKHRLVKNNGDAGAAYPDQNADGLVNSANNIHTFGCRQQANGTTGDQSIDGYISRNFIL